MPYFIKNFDEITSHEWDSYIENHQNSWLWHTSDFIKAKNSWHGHSNQSFGIYDNSQNIVGIFPLYLIESKIFRIFNAPLLDNIGGWLTDDKTNNGCYSQIIIDEFLKKLSKFSCLAGNINFSTASLNQDIDPLFVHGLAGNRAYSSVIDLTRPLEDIWKGFRKGHKSEIKKAENNNITFKLALPEDLECYYGMHKKVYAKSDLLPHNKKYFEQIFNILLPKNNAIVGIALLNGKPIAMANYGAYKGKAVYWTGACFDDAYKVGANHFLHWKMIQHLQDINISWLDMGEIFYQHFSSKIQGISNFKIGFGGKFFPIYKGSISSISKWLKIYQMIRE